MNVWIDYRTFSTAGWKGWYILKQSWRLVLCRKTYSPWCYLSLGWNSSVTHTTAFFLVEWEEGGKEEKERQREGRLERGKKKDCPGTESEPVLVKLQLDIFI